MTANHRDAQHSTNSLPTVFPEPGTENYEIRRFEPNRRPRPSWSAPDRGRHSANLDHARTSLGHV